MGPAGSEPRKKLSRLHRWSTTKKYPTYILNFLNYTLLKVSKNLFFSGFVRKLYRAGYYPANPSNNYLKLRKYFLNGFSRASTNLVCASNYKYYF